MSSEHGDFPKEKCIINMEILYRRRSQEYRDFPLKNVA